MLDHKEKRPLFLSQTRKTAPLWGRTGLFNALRKSLLPPIEEEQKHSQDAQTSGPNGPTA